jgi:hypothetical protein
VAIIVTSVGHRAVPDIPMFHLIFYIHGIHIRKKVRTRHGWENTPNQSPHRVAQTRRKATTIAPRPLPLVSRHDRKWCSMTFMSISTLSMLRHQLPTRNVECREEQRVERDIAFGGYYKKRNYFKHILLGRRPCRRPHHVAM